MYYRDTSFTEQKYLKISYPKENSMDCSQALLDVQKGENWDLEEICKVLKARVECSHNIANPVWYIRVGQEPLEIILRLFPKTGLMTFGIITNGGLGREKSDYNEGYDIQVFPLYKVESMEINNEENYLELSSTDVKVTTKLRIYSDSRVYHMFEKKVE